MALTKISTAMISQSAAAVDLNVDAGTFYVDTTNNRVGVGGKTDPDTPLHVIGTVTATTFAGSGASLTNIPNSALTNSSITINSSAVSLGGSLTLTTANIAENTNLYYTDARADARIAAADTDDLSEGSSNLYYTDARVDARISGGSLGNITTTGYIRGPSSFTIDPAAHGDNSGTVVIAGNLQVDGTTTTINSTTVNVDDLNIQLATGAANAAAANGAGITVDGASATITYDGTNDEWDFNKDVNVTGTLTALGGSSNNDSTANILTLNASEHARLVVDTSSTGGHRATLALKSNGNETQLTTTGSASFLNVASGNLTLDVAGDIILDADGGDIRFRDGGTEVGTIVMDDGSNNYIFKAIQQDADIKFNGNDGGSGINALTLDMSNAGAATFNSFVYLDYIRGKSDANTGVNVAGNDVLALQTGGNIALTLDASQNATFSGSVTAGGLDVNSALVVDSSTGGSTPFVAVARGTTNSSRPVLQVSNANGVMANFQGDGNATFSGSVTTGGAISVAPATGTAKISFTSQGVGSEVFSVNGQIPGVSNTGFAIRNETDSRNDFMLDGSGNATFSGSLTVGGSLNGISTTQSVSGNRWGVLPEVASNGVMEIGRYLDFHATDGDTSDYSARFDYDGSKMILTSAMQIEGNVFASDVISRNSGGLSLQTDDGTKRLFINDDGKVGISEGGVIYASRFSVGKPANHVPGTAFTSSPSSFFSETQLGGTTGDSQKIAIFAGADASNVSGLAIYRYRRSTGSNWLSDGFSLRQEVDSSANIYDYINFAGGNVGIGTTNPAQKFVVAEGTNQHGIELAPGTLSYIQAYDRATSDYGNLKIDAEILMFGTNNGTERMRIDSAGKMHSHYGIHINPNSTNNHVYHQINRTSGHDGHLVFLQSQTPQWQQTTDSSHNLNFYSYQNGAGFQVRFESTGDVALLDGNLKVAAGHGINFSAAANSAPGASHSTLNDYEEGTWTPSITRSISAPAVTYTTQLGSYTKIGRTVHVSGHLSWSANSGGSGHFRIAGLPFTVATGSANYSTMNSVDYSGVTFATNAVTFGGYGAIGGTHIVLLNGLNNGTSSVVINGLASTGFIYFDMTYNT